MAATQLDLFNRALFALGERRLASTSEPREPARVLNDLWSDLLQFCLEQGMWNFAMTSAAVTGSNAGGLGYAYQFSKPSDLVHLFVASIAADFDPPLTGTDFVDNSFTWFANGSPLYIRYTSNSGSYGANFGNWSMTFTTYVAHQLAAWAAMRITGSEQLTQALEQRAARSLVNALAIDSVSQLPGLRPFNAEARAKIVEGFQPTAIETQPFLAALSAFSAAPQRGR